MRNPLGDCLSRLAPHQHRVVRMRPVNRQNLSRLIVRPWRPLCLPAARGCHLATTGARPRSRRRRSQRRLQRRVRRRGRRRRRRRWRGGACGAGACGGFLRRRRWRQRRSEHQSHVKRQAFHEPGQFALLYGSKPPWPPQIGGCLFPKQLQLLAFWYFNK